MLRDLAGTNPSAGANAGGTGANSTSTDISTVSRKSCSGRIHAWDPLSQNDLCVRTTDDANVCDVKRSKNEAIKGSVIYFFKNPLLYPVKTKKCSIDTGFGDLSSNNE